EVGAAPRHRALALPQVLLEPLEIAVLLLDQLDAAVEGRLLLLESALGGELGVAGGLGLALDLLLVPQRLLAPPEDGVALDVSPRGGRLLAPAARVALGARGPGAADAGADEVAGQKCHDGGEGSAADQVDAHASLPSAPGPLRSRSLERGVSPPNCRVPVGS